MKNIFNRQSQFELFPRDPGLQPKKNKMSLFGRSFTVSLENIVLYVIAMVMAMVVSFSFGVEKGKRVRKNDPQLSVHGPQPVMKQEEKMILHEKRYSPINRLPEDSQVEKIVKKEEKEKNVPVVEKKVDKTPTLEKIHTIQVASFKQQSRAEIEVQSLQKRGYDAFVSKKGSYIIVCVGRFAENRMAEPLLKSLKKRYKDCYIRSL